FNAVLTKLKGQQFDVMYVPGYYEELGLIIKQARDLGITAPIAGGDGYESPKLAELAGPALTDVYYTNHYSTEDKGEKVATFVEAYQKKYNKVPESFDALGYDTMQFVADAIKRAESPTGPAIKAAMESTKGFSGVTGTFDVDAATHNPIKEATIIGYKDGKIAVTEKFA
ncbi:MAG: ABC transporter substrate-binding protein, partial [Propionibacteriaceae bacterium]|nr:ABC transporter substrate-binding protein [Propionibacteriaceae bacterium]